MFVMVAQRVEEYNAGVLRSRTGTIHGTSGDMENLNIALAKVNVAEEETLADGLQDKGSLQQRRWWQKRSIYTPLIRHQ